MGATQGTNIASGVSPDFISGEGISLIFAGVFIFLIALGLLKGLSRGTGRQVVRFLTIVVSVIVSLIVTASITDAITELCKDKTLEDVIITLGLSDVLDSATMDLLACFDAVTAERILELPLLTIVMPFIFTSCFVLISAVLLIVHAIICAVLSLSGKRANLTSRLLGALVGTIQGVAAAVIFTLPIVNVVNLADLTVTAIIEAEPEQAEENQICAVYDSYLKATKESPAFQLASSMGANALCDNFATIEIDEEKVNLRSSLSVMLTSFDDFTALSGLDWANPTEEQCQALSDIVNNVGHDNYVASILSGTLRGTAVAIKSDVISLELEEPTLGVMNNLVSIFTTLNSKNFSSDIDTVLDVYFLLAREGVLTSLAGTTEEVTNAFVKENSEGETVIKRIINKLQDNEHMRPLVTMLTKLSLSIMMEDVGVENGDAIYETVKDGITTIISMDKTEYDTNEEYVDAVAESLDSVLKENEIELAPEIVESMAEYISTQDFSGINAEQITDKEVNDTILSYYEAYLKYIENSEEPPFTPNLSGTGDGGSGNGGN